MNYDRKGIFTMHIKTNIYKQRFSYENRQKIEHYRNMLGEKVTNTLYYNLLIL